MLKGHTFGLTPEKARLLVLFFTIAACVALTFYVGFIMGQQIAYPHFFYIPIILAGVWYYKKAVYAALFLSIIYILITHLSTQIVTLVSFERCAVLIAVAYIIGLVSEKRAKAQEVTKLAYVELNQIFNTAGGGMCVIDKDFNLLRINDRLSTLSATNKDEAMGKKCYEVFPVPLCHTPGCSLSRIIGGEERVECEVERERNDGLRIPCILTATPFRGPAGELIGVVENFKDITERKRMEEAFIQSEKLKALGEMAGGVAHDFNNLLAIILGNAQLLERGLNRYKAEEIKERLNTIARTAYEGGETVRRLQHFTDREVSAENFTKIDLNEIVRSAISSTSPRWKDEAEARGVTIRIKEKLGKLPSILGSRSELMEVLTNLIFNAVESMREGGEITVRTEAKKNKLYLYFTDTGQGIPDTIKEKIFDPFFTTKGPKASGLGLSVSYGIIKRHRGKIKVESSKGKGITFTISMPVRLESKKR